MRTLPAWSWIDESHTSSALQVTVTVVDAPVLSSSARGEPCAAPLALFQLLSSTTPACSEPPIGVPRPTKSMLMAFAGDEEPLETVKVVVASVLLVEDAVATAMASTVAEAGKVNVPVYCWVVPAPGEGVLPSVV